jgi:hypothetical protein
MALDFATIVQESQLAVLAALETTAEAARFALIARHRDHFETGARADPTPAGTADQSAETAGELVEQLERLVDTLGRYRAQVLHPEYRQPF